MMEIHGLQSILKMMIGVQTVSSNFSLKKKHMPTIEMISINATRVPDLPKHEGFAYFAEEGVDSHRKNLFCVL